MKFNFPEFYKEWANIAGYRFETQFFIPMTAEEKQRRDANSKAAIAQQQQQGKSQLLDKQNNAKTEQIFDSALARAGEKATVLQTEHALQLGQEGLGTETAG